MVAVESAAEGIAIYKSGFPFGETVERVTEAIQAAGMQIFAHIDHAAAAREAGLDMEPALVLIYGSAARGTPVMNSVPLVALDLPLRVLIRADQSGTCSIAFRPVVPLLYCAGVRMATAMTFEAAQTTLATAIAGGDGLPSTATAPLARRKAR